MLIDRRSNGWIITCIVIFLIATGYYVYYSRTAPNGAHGGSIPGLIYAGVGSGMMLFALLLSGRKKVRTMRIGRAFYWMQGHVWFGLLSYPVIIYHAGGLHWGGTLTQVIMWLFTIVIVSGIVGLILQQIIPTKMLRDVPAETIYEQIDHVLDQLRCEARDLVASVTTRQERPAFEVEVVPAGGTVAAVLSSRPTVSGATMLESFYQQEVAPFLAGKMPRDSKLVAAQSSDSTFAAARAALPSQFHSTLAELQSIADERRQLDQQRRLHVALHGWLLCHVPLSFALVLLSIVHAVEALRFASIR